MADAKAQDYRRVDKFDLVIGSLAGRADVVTVGPSTRQCLTPVVGATQQFTVQTMRVKEEGDWIFIQYLDGDGSQRIAIPPNVAEVIARQRDALSTKNRKAAAKAEALARKARGEVPGFHRKKKPGKRGKGDGQPDPARTGEV